VNARTERESDGRNDSLYDELERVFDQLLICHINILLENFNANWGVRNGSVHEISSENGVRGVKFVTLKNLIVKTTVFLHRNIHKYDWTPPDGKNNQIDHVLVDKWSQV
jgi:hypothetical protein